MEEEDGRPQVIEAAARWLHYQIRLSRKLKGSGTRARRTIDDQHICRTAGDDRVIGGLEPAHRYGRLQPCRIPQLRPLHQRALLGIEVGEEHLHAGVGDCHGKRPGQGRFPDPALLRHETDSQRHPTVP